MSPPPKRKTTLPGKPESYWIASTPETDYPPLPEGLSVDVAILGGGIAGLTSAVLLKEEGLTVAVIEAERIATGVTGHTTAHISWAHGLIYRHLTETFGIEGAKRYAQANRAAMEEIARLIRRYQIDCDYRVTSEYFYTDTRDDLPRLQDEFQAILRLGLPVSFVRDVPLPFETYGALLYEDQAQFHPRKYLLSLAESVPGEGSYIIERTRALNVQDGEPCTITTERGSFTAKDVIIATHFPILNQGMFWARMRPNRSYVLGVRIADTLPEFLFDSTEDPSHYIRSQPTDQGPLVIIGGEDHPTGHESNTVERYRRLEEFARTHFEVTSVDYRWSTQDNYTDDRIPFIGRMAAETKHLFVATGFKGWGMTHGTLAGMILADLITDQINPFDKLFSPGRFKLAAAAPELIARNLHVTETFIKGRFTRLSSLHSLSPGEAEVAELKGEKVAAYRDESGHIHIHSPVCSHMGCIVRWNEAERSWDCPCHGSRFRYDGKVIQAPAVKDLQKIAPRDGSREKEKSPKE
jgi:glycine/D-amino acid oxidase-like deaminating enzyme/nitrite reductase/ring-hydroxylating ferredoxin subunit